MKTNTIIAIALAGAGFYLWQKNKKDGKVSKYLGFSSACGCGK